MKQFAKNFVVGLTLELGALALIASAVGWFSGYRLAAVESGSMVPAFRIGDAVITKLIKSAGLHVGDVVSFASSEKRGAIISHRIIAINVAKGLLFTKGDYLTKPDTPIRNADVRSKVIGVVPHLGYAIDFSHQPPGIACLCLTLLAVVAYEFYRLGQQHHHCKFSYSRQPRTSA
jgi:signal peptidase I